MTQDIREIPKIINYCWFGRGNKNKLIKNCIDSWKLNLPDYRIIEWNEDNFDIATAPRYVQEAYQEKKYAFVSDYVRLYALNINGGLYFDTDIQVVKNFDGILCGQKMVIGFEMHDSVMTGMIAAIPKHPVIVDFLAYYDNIRFLNADGSYNLQVNPVVFTEILDRYGLKHDGKKQFLEQGIVIYPVDFFCAFDLHNDHEIVSDNTYTIHHYTGSWNDATIKKKFVKRKLVSILGARKYESMKNLYKRLFK